MKKFYYESWLEQYLMCMDMYQFDIDCNDIEMANKMLETANRLKNQMDNAPLWLANSEFEYSNS